MRLHGYLTRLLIAGIAGIAVIAIVVVGSRVADSRREALYRDPAEVAVRLRIAFDATSSSDEFRRSVQWLGRAPRDLVVPPTVREFALEVSGTEPGWLDSAESEVPPQDRRAWRLWQILIRQHSNLQRVAEDPENSEFVWQVVRALPNTDSMARSIKMQLLQGLMEQRISAVRKARYGPVPKLIQKQVPAIDEELIQVVRQLLPEIPADEEQHAYFFALRYGDYLGKDFQPSNSNAPKYRGKHGLNAEYFSEPVRRAKREG